MRAVALQAPKKAKKISQKFTIKCSGPVDDEIFDIASFVRCLPAQNPARKAGGPCGRVW